MTAGVGQTEFGVMKRIRVLLGDDHALILDGIRASLQLQFDIVGQATDGKALVQAAERLRPDLVILDISMPLLNGFFSIEVTRMPANSTLA